MSTITSFVTTLSRVEQNALAHSPFETIYPPEEKIPVITVPNFPALGKLAAMRFLEWAQTHPGGVISLPTGKSPEHFIVWVEHTLDTWDEAQTRRALEEAGVDPVVKPDMKSLHFVQVDEFYPKSPEHANSFTWYVRKYYLDGFGLDSGKALLMNNDEIGLGPGETLEALWPESVVDLSLRTRQPTTWLERAQRDLLLRIDDWSQRREEAIRGLGGLGFFLGGIGPDGHIGFNVRGSDHYSTTRLTGTNYETQAAAAGDLGGIENSRTRLVITIGLGTITFNPECVAIIIAAGEAKARVVADAVQGETSVLVPASALRRLPQARFYITMGAGSLLRQRCVSLICETGAVSAETVERALVDLCLATGKKLSDLREEDADKDPLAAKVVRLAQQPLSQLADLTRQSLIRKIDAGSLGIQGAGFLHTEPHHDDLMLGYLPLIVRNIRHSSNDHHFVTLTSGFTAVTNEHMLRRLRKLSRFIGTPAFVALHQGGYFDPGREEGRNRDVWQYLDGIAAKREDMQDEGDSRRLLRDLVAVCDEQDLDEIRDRIEELDHYLRTVYPGKKDPEHIQRLKGMCREWEAECLWGYFGWQSSHIHHLRLGFYTGDLFNPEPTLARDVQPIQDLLKRVKPDIVSVALDPEASGPDTHYKALQAVNEAVRRHGDEHPNRRPRIWGYRNVWFRFHPSEANLFVPVSLNMFSVMESSFHNTFVSQREASFPSPDHDGPFCELAQKI